MRVGASLAATAQGRAAAAAAAEAAEEQQSLDLADFILALSDRVKRLKKADSPGGTVTCHAVTWATMLHRHQPNCNAALRLSCTGGVSCRKG